jgi:hypothetical protein
MESIGRYANVAANAGNKAIAGLPDMLLNTPTNLLNLGKMQKVQKDSVVIRNGSKSGA